MQRYCRFLIINEEQIKYMIYRKRYNPADFFEIEQHTFENVKKFNYLESEVEYQNENSPKTQT